MKIKIQTCKIKKEEIIQLGLKIITIIYPKKVIQQSKIQDEIIIII